VDHHGSFGLIQIDGRIALEMGDQIVDYPQTEVDTLPEYADCLGIADQSVGLDVSVTHHDKIDKARFVCIDHCHFDCLEVAYLGIFQIDPGILVASLLVLHTTVARFVVLAVGHTYLRDPSIVAVVPGCHKVGNHVVAGAC
jgi:hypothetical protein